MLRSRSVMLSAPSVASCASARTSAGRLDGTCR